MTPKLPIRVAVTGAAGHVSYALLFQIASGSMFGPDQPVILHLVEIPLAESALRGVIMELEDCAFPLLQGIVPALSPEEGFKGVNWALLVGSIPRKKGMERKDLLLTNGKLFLSQGKAIEKSAAPDVSILVVGNPCNTNCWIAKESAPGIPSEHWFAMTRLDENRAKAQLGSRAGVPTTSVTNVAIWGNHSATQYPDFTHAQIGGKPASEVIANEAWLEGDFIKAIQQRGTAVLNARGSSSAASAANAIVDTVRSLTTATATNDWHSVAVSSDGIYGVEKGLVSSFPIRSDGKKWHIVPNLTLNDFSHRKIAESVKELVTERDTVKQALGI